MWKGGFEFVKQWNTSRVDWKTKPWQTNVGGGGEGFVEQ